MDPRSWFASRLKDADLVNLGVIVAFAILLGVGAVVAMTKDQAPRFPGPLDDFDDEKDEDDEGGDDDHTGEGGDDDDDRGDDEEKGGKGKGDG